MIQVKEHTVALEFSL
jgi:hypothetical protein